MALPSFLSTLLRSPLTTPTRPPNNHHNSSTPFPDSSNSNSLPPIVSLSQFISAWESIQEVLQDPDEKQILKGVEEGTRVGEWMEVMINGLEGELSGGEGNGSTGPCLEYFLNHLIYNHLVALSSNDIPYGIESLTLKFTSSLLSLLPSHYLVHHALHRPLLQLLHSSIRTVSTDGGMRESSPDLEAYGMGRHGGRWNGSGNGGGLRGEGEGMRERERKMERGMGRAMGKGKGKEREPMSRREVEKIEQGLVDVLRRVCERMEEYPPLLLIFMHDESEPLIHSSKRSNNPNTVEDLTEEEEEELAGLGYLGNEESLTDEKEEKEARELIKKLMAKNSLNESPTSSSTSSSSSKATSPPSAPPFQRRHPQPRSDNSAYLDFVFFEYLMEFVHREGEIGWSAREGLRGLFGIAFGVGMEDDETVTRRAGAEGTEIMGLEMMKERHSATKELRIGSVSPKGMEPIKLARLQLATHILNNKYVDVIIAGLGAVYSLIPSKVKLPTEREMIEVEGVELGRGMVGRRLGDGGMGKGSIGGHESDTKGESIQGGEDLKNLWDPDVQDTLENYILIFDFIGGILQTCLSSVVSTQEGNSEFAQVARDIASSIESNFRTAFLENILYPEVMGISTIDGSGVAVVSYLDALLQDMALSRKDNILCHMMIRVLSKSTDKEGDLTMDMSLLKDLTLNMISGNSEDSRIVALRLIGTLCADYCGTSSAGLWNEVRDTRATMFSVDLLGLQDWTSPSTPPMSPELKIMGRDGKAGYMAAKHAQEETDLSSTVGLHMFPSETNTLPRVASFKDTNIDLYRALLSHLDPRGSPPTEGPIPESYVQGAYSAISRSSCFRQVLADLHVVQTDGKQSLSVHGNHCDHSHRLDPSDKLLPEMLSCLRHIFSGSPRHTLALTGAISALLTCPFRSLGDWTTKSPFRLLNVCGSESVLGHHRQGDGNDPFLDEGSSQLPALYLVLRDLIRQVSIYRSTTQAFDQHLDNRRRGLIGGNGFRNTTSAALPVPPSGSTTPTPSPSKGFLRRSSTQTGRFATGIATFLSPRRATDQSLPSESDHSLTEDSSLPAKFKSDHGPTEREVQPLIAAEISSGPWTPSKKSRSTQDSLHPSPSNRYVDLQQTSDNDSKRETAAIVDLVDILDNVIILEEFLKETMALLYARRTLGIDGP